MHSVLLLLFYYIILLSSILFVIPGGQVLACNFHFTFSQLIPIIIGNFTGFFQSPAINPLIVT